MSRQVDPGTLERIACFDVPTISNAIELFGVRANTDGYMGPEVRAIGDRSDTVVGYAVTGKISALVPPTDLEKRLLTPYYEALRHSFKPPFSVIQDIDERPTGSFWGEVNATIHLALGCRVAITNGGVRDVDAMGDAGFSSFATCILVSHASVHLVDVGCPVQVGGIWVNHGDILAADKHGIISIPSQIVHRLEEACEYVQRAELEVLAPCRSIIRDGRIAEPNELVAWRSNMADLLRAFPL